MKNNIDSVIEITVNLSSPSSKIVQKNFDSPTSFKEETDNKTENSLYDTKSFNHENKSKTKSLFFESSFQIFKENSLNELEKKSTVKKISLQNSKETVFRDVSSNLQKKHSKNEIYDKGNSKSMNFNFQNKEKLMLVQKDLTLKRKKSPTQYFKDNNKKRNKIINPIISEKYSLSTSIPDIKEFYNDIKGTRSPLKRNNQSKIKNGKVNLVYNLQNKISYHMMSSLDHKYKENRSRINKLQEADFISEELSEGFNLENYLDSNNRNELNVRVVSDKLEKVKNCYIFTNICIRNLLENLKILLCLIII